MKRKILVAITAFSIIFLLLVLITDDSILPFIYSRF